MFQDGNASGDLVGGLTQRIESHFGIEMEQLRKATTAAPGVNSDATDIVRWHGLLVEAQARLDYAEDELLTALHTQHSEVDEPTMELAQRVNAAVSARDGRAQVLRWFLDPDAPGKANLAERSARHGVARKRPGMQANAPVRPATAPVPGAGRGARR